MRSMRGVVRDIAAKRRSQMNEHQHKLAETFYEAIEGWNDGFLTLDDVVSEAGPWYVIQHVIFATSPDHRLWREIMAFCEQFWFENRGRGVATRQGWFSEEEIQQSGGKLDEVYDPETSEVVLHPVWPTGYAPGIDGKPDMSRPIYGNEPRLRPYVEPLAPVRRPDGYEIWNDLTQVDG